MTTPDRWVRFESAQGPRQGYIEGETIVPIAGDMFGDWRPEADPVPLTGARLLAPVIPPTFYACGINYAGHWRTAAEEFGLDLDKSWPKYPEVGYRAQSAIIGPGDPIILPADVPPNVQVEGELAVVIGRRAKHVRPEDALDHVFGYTIGNDVSARGWQFSDRTFWRSKNADTFKPLGPWIRRGVDLDSLVTRVSVNGELRESFPTNRMIWSIADYIAAITRYITLIPGDVIIMGTDGHCPQLNPGDTVSIEIEGIGTLSNPVVAE
ncbi:MAG: fumarylacetoacetate hydrolase family protein [Sphingomonadales bacterium]|nr:fumarylacetoacetate hydrolase family protein [Sphingomonadales bacterium]